MKNPETTEEALRDPEVFTEGLEKALRESEVGPEGIGKNLGPKNN